MDLFNGPSPGAYRGPDPDTSVEAAYSVDATRLEALVVEALRRHPGGLTSHEMADELQLSLVTVSPRFAPLVRKKKVIDSGEKRAGGNGRRSIVWCLRQEG